VTTITFPASLATALKERLLEKLPGTVLHTPLDPELSGGVVVFTVPGGGAQRAIYQQLYETHGVAGASQGRFDGVRLCPHIYNTEEHIDRAIRGVAANLDLLKA